MKIESLVPENVGQIKRAEISFGDLTVLVGPQATGKSIFLEFLKLLTDTRAIQDELRLYGAQWGEMNEFLDLFLGEGMASVWTKGKSAVTADGTSIGVENLVMRSQRSRDESLFLIPAQRVLTLRDGWPRPFSDYGAGDPFTVKHFSERLRLLMETELGREQMVFPKTRKLKAEIREMLISNVFGNFDLRVEKFRSQKRIVLGPENEGASLPFMVWSAGQREFVPLLLGFYWLLPPTKVPRKDKIDWVVIEELEMGLHPKAISAVLLLVLELLSRGYRVCLSTHSPHILDLVWGMRVIREHDGDPNKVLEMLGATPTQSMNSLAYSAKTKRTKVYYFDRDTGTTTDISELDPGSTDARQAGWGGLSEFSGRVADIVAEMVNESNIAD